MRSGRFALVGAFAWAALLAGCVEAASLPAVDETCAVQASAEDVEHVDGRECCKVCEKGCACGDSCISCSKTCHRPPGCACDAPR